MDEMQEFERDNLLSRDNKPLSIDNEKDLEFGNYEDLELGEAPDGP
jgi:hypothetical protein